MQHLNSLKRDAEDTVLDRLVNLEQISSVMRPIKRQKIPTKSKKCPHGKSSRGYYCIKCGGKGLCKKHGRAKHKCVPCGGKKYERKKCIHNRQQSKCIPCGGRKYGPYLCCHGKRQNGRYCKLCKEDCKHGIMFKKCKECVDAFKISTGNVQPRIEEKKSKSKNLKLDFIPTFTHTFSQYDESNNKTIDGSALNTDVKLDFDSHTRETFMNTMNDLFRMEGGLCLLPAETGTSSVLHSKTLNNQLLTMNPKEPIKIVGETLTFLEEDARTTENSDPTKGGGSPRKRDPNFYGGIWLGGGHISGSLSGLAGFNISEEATDEFVDVIAI